MKEASLVFIFSAYSLDHTLSHDCKFSNLSWGCDTLSSVDRQPPFRSEREEALTTLLAKC